MGSAATSAASVGRQLSLQRQALESSQASYDFSQKRYGQGLGNALIVLNAETQMLSERRLEVDLEYRALDVQAQLMKALGGVWTAGTASAPAGTASAPASGSVSGSASAAGSVVGSTPPLPLVATAPPDTSGSPSVARSAGWSPTCSSDSDTVTLSLSFYCAGSSCRD